MIAFLKSLFSRTGTGETAAPPEEAVEYKGFRIRPAPYPAGSGHQTAGIIEKDFESGTKEYRFVRAETHPSRNDAVAFAVTKGKQIIDEQGDRVFEARR